MGIEPSLRTDQMACMLVFSSDDWGEAGERKGMEMYAP
jgi:hypothetical protein